MDEIGQLSQDISDNIWCDTKIQANNMKIVEDGHNQSIMDY